MSDEVKSLSSNYMRDPINIDVSEAGIVTADINHVLYITDEEKNSTY
jgi:superfamily II DNA/RNA helicase